MDSVETVSAAYEAFGKGDVPTLLSLLDDEVDWISPMTLPHGGRYHGREDVGRFFQGIGELWDPLTVALKAVASTSSDSVVTLVDAKGSLRSGGTAGYGAAHHFTVRDGKITRFREYVDLDKPLHS
jgi:ketosteroid isomerase-like protein